MALSPLFLDVTYGVAGSRFQASISGQSSGSTIEVLNDGTPGFYAANGRVYSDALPARPLVTVVLRETKAGEGFRDSRIDIAVDGIALGAAGLPPTLDGLGYNVPVSPEMFGSSADAAAMFEAAMAAAGKRPIICRPGATYVFNRIAIGRNSVSIDLNGATLVAPKGALSIANIKFNGSAGAYFTSVSGSDTFLLPAAATGLVAVGDVIIFRSNTNWSGAYKFGQMSRVVGVSGSTIKLDRPFYASYSVDLMQIYSPLVVSVSNGRIDMTGAVQPTGSDFPAIGINLIGDYVSADKLSVVASADAGIGILLQGLQANATDCRTDGFRNARGLGSVAGRVGYGIQLNGDMCYAIRCGGNNCKHVISGSDRSFRTQLVRLEDCWGNTPPDAADALATLDFDGSTQPLYNGILDCHGNTERFEVINARTDGVNSHIFVRNGSTLIENFSFTHRGVATPGAGVPSVARMVIAAFEETIRDLRVANVVANMTRAPTNTNATFLFGVAAGAGGVHDSVTINDVDVRGTGNAALTLFDGSVGSTGIANFSFTGLRGNIMDGVKFGTSTASNFNGTVGRCNIEGEFTLTPVSNYSNARVVDSYANRITLLRGRGTWSHAGTLANANYTMVSLGDGSAFTPPEFIDFRDLTVNAAFCLMSQATSSLTAMSGADFSRMKLTYNLSASAGQTNGISLNLGAQPASAFLFGGARIINANPGQANSQPLRFTGASRLDFSGLTVSEDVFYSGNPTVPKPSGFRKTDGTRPVFFASTPPILIDESGNYYAITVPTVGTSVLRLSDIVYNADPAVSGLAGWMQTVSGTWKTMARQA